MFLTFIIYHYFALVSLRLGQAASSQASFKAMRVIFSSGSGPWRVTGEGWEPWLGALTCFRAAAETGLSCRGTSGCPKTTPVALLVTDLRWLTYLISKTRHSKSRVAMQLHPLPSLVLPMSNLLMYSRCMGKFQLPPSAGRMGIILAS